MKKGRNGNEEQQLFRLRQQLSSEGHHKVRSVTHLDSEEKKWKLGTSCSCFCAASTISFAAGWTTSISFTMVAVSLVMNILSSWLTTNLNIPANHSGRATPTIRTHRRSVDARQFFTCIDVADDRVLRSREGLVATSQQTIETRSRIQLLVTTRTAECTCILVVPLRIKSGL